MLADLVLVQASGWLQFVTDYMLKLLKYPVLVENYMQLLGCCLMTPAFQSIIHFKQKKEISTFFSFASSMKLMSLCQVSFIYVAQNPKSQYLSELYNLHSKRHPLSLDAQFE